MEAKFTELKSPYTQEEFQKQLNARQMTAEDLKTQLRRDLSVQKLLHKEITTQNTITNKDISEIYKDHDARLSTLCIPARPRPVGLRPRAIAF